MKIILFFLPCNSRLMGITGTYSKTISIFKDHFSFILQKTQLIQKSNFCIIIKSYINMHSQVHTYIHTYWYIHIFKYNIHIHTQRYLHAHDILSCFSLRNSSDQEIYLLEKYFCKQRQSVITQRIYGLNMKKKSCIFVWIASKEKELRLVSILLTFFSTKNTKHFYNIMQNYIPPKMYPK